MTSTLYTLNPYADGFGVWHCTITFPHGAGNAPEGQRLIETARAAARRRIRAELQARQGAPLGRLRFTITANREYPWGALASLTISENQDEWTLHVYDENGYEVAAEVHPTRAAARESAWLHRDTMKHLGYRYTTRIRRTVEFR